MPELTRPQPRPGVLAIEAHVPGKSAAPNRTSTRCTVAFASMRAPRTSSQATTIGMLETVGLSWKLMDSELEDLKSVTPQDIQSAARTYFTRDRLSIAHVLPEEAAHE